MAKPKTHVRFIDAKDLGLKNHPNLEMPEVEEGLFPLIDHDVGECRNIGKDELSKSYVDQNIVRIEPMQPDPWTLDPASLDKQNLAVTYQNGTSLEILFGSIALSGGPTARNFMKTGGITYPVDEGGLPLMNATNTPILSSIRLDMLEQLAARSEQRLEVVEVAAAFGSIIALRSGGSLPFP